MLNRAINEISSTIFLGIVLGLASAASLAQERIANNTNNGSSTHGSNFPELLNDTLTNSRFCESSFNNNMSAGTSCILANALNAMLREGVHWATPLGKSVFGDNFNIVSKFAPSQSLSGGGLQGDLDVVFPLAGAVSGSFDRLSGSALFFQQGMTRWWDSGGNARHDTRHGLVQRFRLTNDPRADVLGSYLFYLQNAEYGHEVLAMGIGYLGKWGSASLRYYRPMTEWRYARQGYEERAVENLEYGTRLKLTTTLNVDLTGYRFRAEDGSGKWLSGARAGFEWRPHPWLAFSTNHRFGRDETDSSVYFNINVPIGGRNGSLPKWTGLGMSTGGSAPTDSDMWLPVNNIGPIMLATRTVSSDSSGDISVRFLQNSAESGGVVQLEVELAAPATSDTRVSVRLVPGNGDNPAVAGEDFVDDPVEATILKGQTSVTVSISLLENNDMQETRSLSATVSVLS